MAHSIELSGNKIKQPADYLNTQECIMLINNKCAKTTKEPWNRLGRTAHIEKLTTFVETILKDEYSLTESETKDGIEFLIKMNERKRFSRQKDITFNRETSIIVTIPILVFNETTRQFSLQSERKLNTVKNTTATKKQGKPKVRPRSKTCDEGESK